MQVRFWGTRGSIAAPGPSTMRYGGNTSCVEVRLNDDALIIFDAGTGIRALGQTLLAHPGPVRAHLFLSHAHWDHIQGIPFFTPAYIAGTELTILGPAHGRLTLEKIVTGQMRSPYFPIPMHAMAAKIEFVKLGERSVVELPNGTTVEAGVLNHPGCTLGYRLTAKGKVLAYTTDNEPFGEAAASRHLVKPSRHTSLVRDADLLIQDASTRRRNTLRIASVGAILPTLMPCRLRSRRMSNVWCSSITIRVIRTLMLITLSHNARPRLPSRVSISSALVLRKGLYWCSNTTTPACSQTSHPTSRQALQFLKFVTY